MDLSPEAKRAFQLQSYTPAQAIDGVELVDLKRFSDDGGNFTELVRLGAGRAEALRDFTVHQVNYSEVEPGVIKAFHVHTRQTDRKSTRLNSSHTVSSYAVFCLKKKTTNKTFRCDMKIHTD